MGLLGALGGQLVFFALSALLMQLALKRRPEGGLFSALTLGMLPAIVLFAVEFGVLQQRDRPDVKALFAETGAQAGKMIEQYFPKPEQAELRKELAAKSAASMEIMPAAGFIFRMAVLGGLAAWFRRRQARLGLSPAPEPLSQWTAPFGLIWLVLAPGFLLWARRSQHLEMPPWAGNAAWNLLAVGIALYLFQGLVVLGAKLSAWSKDPGTRVFVPLVLAAAAISVVFQDGGGLFVFLVLTGLFEPWIDLRRLHHPPEAGGEA